MFARIAAAALLALSLTACSESTLPEDEWLRVRTTEWTYFTVTNEGDARVYFVASDLQNMALLTCTPSTCTSVAPGETTSVNFADIYGWDDGDFEARLSWWIFEEGTGRTRAQGNTVVRLRE